MKKSLLFLPPLLGFALSASAQDATTITPEQLAQEEQAINISDGVFREYRLAVLFTREEYNSPRFNRDRNKIKAHLKELEDYLNSIYVRDAGVKFTMVYDDRLIDTSLPSDEVFIDFNTSTNAINNHIGADAYDIGVVCNYYGSIDAGGTAGRTSFGCIQWEGMKGNVESSKQNNRTIAHELTHAFGCEHTWVTGSEPGQSGQSIAGYGFSSSTHFLSLASLNQLITIASRADKWRNAAYIRTVSTTNTAPRIERDRMKREYVVPKNTFFTIPVYATDDEQTELNYAYAQWDFLAYKAAHFPTFPSQHSNVFNFGRTYSTANNYLVLNSDNLPVGNYKMLFSVSDAIPTEEAIAKKQAPLRDNYLTMIKVVDVEKPFKMDANLKTEFKTGERFTLTWDVDKTFFGDDSKVRVLLSDDGGITFNHILVPETANDGECEVVMPQQAIGEKYTYENISKMGKAVLRLEVIGKGYYDISNNNPSQNDPCQGGSTVTDCGIQFNNLPESNYLKLAYGETAPVAPTLTATKNGVNVPVTYSESKEGNLTRRLWVANDGTTESAYVQWVESEANAPINVSFAYTDGAIKGIDYICSYSAPYPTQLPEGIKAYYISPSKSDAERAIMLEWNDRIIPANQGMLLTSESGDDVELQPVSDQVGELNEGTNLLKHSAGASKVIAADDNAFILAYGSNGLAFCKAKVGSTLAANKAYLSLPTSAQSIRLDFNSTTTGIDRFITTDAKQADANAPLYDLSGRRVAQPTKGGVYIRNGKKIIF